MSSHRRHHRSWRGASLALAGVCIATASYDARQPAAPAPVANDDPFPSTGALISEVLFHPADGAAPFVELANAGLAAVEVGTMALRIGDQFLGLAQVDGPLAPGGRLLVIFDGSGVPAPGVVHAPMGVTLPQPSGAVELLNYLNDPVDRVAWGEEAGPVRLDSGMPGEELPPGSTIGRPPGATTRDSLTDWVVYRPGDATPGKPNPLPPLSWTDLAPIPGALLAGPTVSLSWFPSTGASKYRVQVGADRTLAKPRVDQIVDVPRLALTLDPGEYFWRVRAISTTGDEAAFSGVTWFRVAAPASRPAPFARWLPAWLPRAPALASRGFAASAPAAQPAPGFKQLPVPLLLQHKDTGMLLLESPNRTGDHAWNMDHSTQGGTTDPADTWNCALANVAMVNHFYGGDLSQDRIGYEMLSRNVDAYRAMFTTASGGIPPGLVQTLHEVHPGPEWDLSYGNGISGGQVLAALAYALGGLPRFRLGSSVASVDAAWTLITSEIDDGRPLIAGIGNHTFTIYGYQLLPGGGHKIFINDPLWDQQQRESVIDGADATFWSTLRWFLMPTGPITATHQEAAVTADADGDGVVDFDEVERFFTDPHKRDSDGDGVPDREDIASGVFELDHQYGWGVSRGPGRDFDHDGLPTERDPDSDNGGCKDGEEDRNGSGSRDGRETWNFDDADDLCQGVNGVVKYATVVTMRSPEAPDFRLFSAQTGRITVRMKNDPGDPGALVDNGSTYREQHSALVIVFRDAGCTAYGREFHGTTGTFRDPGKEIGGRRDRNTLVIGAGGDAQGRSWANLCVISGGNELNGGFSLPACEAKADPKAPGTYVFDCRGPDVPPPPNYTILTWTVTGRVKVP